jgi:Major Facilitator Superfamily
VNRHTRSVNDTSSPRSGTGIHDPRAWLYAGLAVAAVGWGAQEFTPLLLFYQSHLHLSTTTLQATFVPYVVGLIPGLLLGGPCSDRYGRRKVLAVTMIATALGSVLLIGGATGITWIMAGRAVAGIASGAGFSSGSAWIKELSATTTDVGINPGPRRFTITMGLGFTLGPLVAGILAQWGPAPTITPYLPHLALAAAAFAAVLRAPETLTPTTSTDLLRHFHIDEVRNRRFRTVILPLAPWVFATVAIALGYLPALVKTHITGYPAIYSAGIVVCNAGAGVLIQPLARRINHPNRPQLLATATIINVAGLLIAALAAALIQPAIALLAALTLGAGYGCLQVYGLLEVQRLARPDHLAGLTAIYQALGYIGFTASYPLAALATYASPATLLTWVAALAALTLILTTRAAIRTAPQPTPTTHPMEVNVAASMAQQHD